MSSGVVVTDMRWSPCALVEGWAPRPSSRGPDGPLGVRRIRMKSAEWITEVTDDSFVTPETLTDEQRLIAKTAAEFVAGEVTPALPQLEAKDWGLARRLV